MQLVTLDPYGHLGRVLWLGLLLLLGGCVSSSVPQLEAVGLQSPQTPLALWQGEWQGGEQGRAERSMLQISGCEDHKGCQVKIIGEQCGVSTAELQLTAPSTSQVRTKDAFGHHKDASVSLELAEGGKTIKASYKGDDWGFFCKAALDLPASFTLRSRANYLSKDLGDCYRSSSRATALWCIDSALQALDQSLQSTIDGVGAIGGQERYLRYQRESSAVRASCEQALLLSACMRAEYQKKITQAHGEKSRWESSVREAGPVDDASAKLKQLAGVYKYRFQNGLVTGEVYESEDILELVPVDEQAMYFKISTNFFNGHTCYLTGVAVYTKSRSFVYEDADDGTCILLIKPSSQGIVIDDPLGSCRSFACGARGSLSDHGHFTWERRRSIRYLPRILKSTEYQDALRQYSLVNSTKRQSSPAR